MRLPLLPLVVLAGCVHPPAPGDSGFFDTVRFSHRVEFGPIMPGELEVSWLSDRNVLEEFFEKEGEEGGKR